MKKIFILGISLVVMTVAATAQSGSVDRLRDNRIAQEMKRDNIQSERNQFSKDNLRYNDRERGGRHRGFMGRRERRRMERMRRHERHERMFRVHHRRYHRHIM